MTRINVVDMLQCIIEMVVYDLNIIIMLNWVDDMFDGCYNMFMCEYNIVYIVFDPSINSGMM